MAAGFSNEPTLPLALKAFTWAVEAFLVAAQAHFAVLLHRALRKRGVRWTLPLSVFAGGAGLFLVGISEMVTLQLEADDFARSLPQALNLASAVHVVGSLGAYSVYLAWLALGRRREPRPSRAPDAAMLSRRQLLETGAQAAMAAPFVVSGYGAFLLRRDFTVRETELRIEGLPAGLDGLKIAQISDIHYGPYLGRKDLERVVDMANELRPQLAVLTGDFITRPGDPLEECLDVLARVRADSGVWGCLGNHEASSECQDQTQRYAASKGIAILRQQRQALRFGDAALNLVGVDYQRTSRPYLPNADRWLDPAAFNLLLSHNPDVFPQAAELGYDLTLAGHTHGGQITVEIVEQTVNPGRFFTPFVVGDYWIGHRAAYVTRGVGTVNMPIRIGAQPEVASLILRSA